MTGIPRPIEEAAARLVRNLICADGRLLKEHSTNAEFHAYAWKVVVPACEELWMTLLERAEPDPLTDEDEQLVTAFAARMLRRHLESAERMRALAEQVSRAFDVPMHLLGRPEVRP